MENVKKLKKPVKMRFAKSGTFLTAEKIVDMTVEAQVSHSNKHITIKNVLLIANLEFNLLSVHKLEMNGLEIIFKDGGAKVLKNYELMAVAHTYKVYKSAFSSVDVECAAIKLGTSETAELWHKRLGHIGRKGLEKVKDLVSGINLNLKDDPCICSVYIESKQTKPINHCSLYIVI